MTTVNGYILDADDVPQHVLITFTPLSTPLAKGGGIVIGKPAILTKPNANDGSFSIQLEAGDYDVSFDTKPVTIFRISVPADNGTYTIDALVTTALTYTYTAPPNQFVDASQLQPILSGNNSFRFYQGNFWIWDSVAFAADNTKPWRAIGALDGQVTLGEPSA